MRNLVVAALLALAACTDATVPEVDTSVIGAGEPRMDEAEIERKIEEVVATIPDPAGTFYRFGMGHSLLRRVKATRGETAKGDAA